MIVDSAAQEGVRVGYQDWREAQAGEHRDHAAWETDREADAFGNRLERMTRIAGDTSIPAAHRALADRDASDVANVLRSLEDRLAQIERATQRPSQDAASAVESAAIPGVVESRAPWPAPHAGDLSFTDRSFAPHGARPARDEMDFDPRPTLSIPRHAADDAAPRHAEPSIADHRPAAPSPNDRFSGLDDTLAEIAERQRVLDAQHEAAAEARRAEAESKPSTSLGERLASLSRRLSRRGSANASTKKKKSGRDTTTTPTVVDRPAPSEPVEAAAVEAYAEPQDQTHLRQNDDDARWAGLQSQLEKLTGQIAGLGDASAFTESVNALRQEIASIGRTLAEAAPRRALQAVEADIRTLDQRIDIVRQQGIAPETIAAIEGSLSDIRQTLEHVSPAESLAEFQQDVRALDARIDTIVRRGEADEGALRQLERAVADLREMTSRAASGEALVALAEEVQTLSEKIDRVLLAPAQNSDVLSRLESRLEDLTSSIHAEIPERAAASDKIMQVVEALADRFERDETSASSPVLDQIANQLARLTVKFEASSTRLDNIDAIERTLSDLFNRLEEIQIATTASAEKVARQAAYDTFAETSGERSDLESLKREFENLRHENAASERRTQDTIEAVRQEQSLNDQRTQDTLEAVHDTLQRLVDRLAMIESDMRSDAMSRLVERGPVNRYEPPRPPEPRDRPPSIPASAAPQLVPGHDDAETADAAPLSAAERPPIDPTLPADHPLEPGTATSPRGPQTAAERIAASEALLGAPKPASESESKANFIAAARRAAQAAATMAATPNAEADEKKAGKSTFSAFRHLTRRRPLMLGLAILAIAGTLHIVVNVLGSSPTKQSHLDKKPASKTALAAPERLAPVDTAKKGSMLTPAPSSLPLQTASAPTAPEAQPEAKVPVPEERPAAQGPASAEPKAREVSKAQEAAAEPETTASVSPLTIASIQIPTASEAGKGFNMSPGQWSTTPVTAPSDGIGPGLRAAADAGNPAAAYEIGVRYADGRGVAANPEEAARWLERAASANLAPAQYRLGSLYEKGQGVKKDLERARRLYASAAERGNAKAMHNLAVLYAEGIDGKPDFTVAATWFRKAAARGMGDSQYNLGILHARGLGVEQNLAESYKWFALAAQQGDKDAGKKRDDVAARLDQQALVAARLAVQTFTVEPQPEDAIAVKTPAGGWEQAAPAAPAAPKAASRRKTGTS
ncbi:MAG: hypothetical protein AB7K64_05565 [Variibacter sp.]